jgi:hypothetical protein
MDIALSFWTKTTELVDRKKIYSIDKVKTELVSGDDELSKWAKERPPFFFLPITAVEMNAYAAVVQWASESDYKPHAKDRFMQPGYADPFLIAYALSHKDITVVTEEVSARDSKKDIKLPDACAHFRIRSIHFMEMLREMKVTY